MTAKIVIVGGVAAGASAAAKARRVSEDIEIILVEAGPYISFANCGLPYYVGGRIEQRDSLFVADAKQFSQRFNIDLRVNTRAQSIDPAAKTVTLTDAEGRSPSECIAYDKLVLATGADAIRPPVSGLDGPNVFTMRTVPDVDAIVDHMGKTGESTRVLVIGGGFIGLEAAEQFLSRNMKVSLVEMADQLMPAMDVEMAWPLCEALTDAGADVLLSDALAEITHGEDFSVARTASGREIPFDLAILATGVRPNVSLAVTAGVETGPTGAIAVDAFQRTNVPDIYAAGDNSETPHTVLGRTVNIPLAGPANKAGRAAGANAALDLMGADDNDPRRCRLTGVLGTSVVGVCGKVAAATGLTEKQAKAEDLDHKVTYIPSANHASYYGGAEPLVLKLIWSPTDGKILGAQAVGGCGVDKRIDVIATAIAGKLSVHDLEQLDLCYAPPFGSAKDAPIMAGFAASNTTRGFMPTITPTELLDALDSDDAPAVIDVRSAEEYNDGHLPQAVNIPVDQMRDRLDEVPTDRPVALHCGVGYRSYVAQRILMNNGRDNVLNTTGGWTVISQVLAARGDGRAES